MNFLQFIIFVLIPSGIISAIVGSLVTYFSNKNLDFQRRIMERRKEVYTKVHELFKGLYSTATPEKRSETIEEALKYYREIQIWGSDKVIRKFTMFLKAVDIKNKIPQQNRDCIYKEFIIAICQDLLGKTGLSKDEIEVYGKII